MSSRTDEFEDLEYSKDVLWVYRHLAYEQVRRGHAGVTKSRVALWEWAVNPANKEKFLSAIVPKAEAALQKHREAHDDERVVQTERKTVRELKGMLREALDELSDGEEDTEGPRKVSE